jgi:hypothetical protein
MKAYFYSLLTVGSLLTTAPAQATISVRTSTENPAEIQRKTAARAKVAEAKKAASTAKRSVWAKTRKARTKLGRTMLVVLGLEESKAVTSPAKLTRQLHAHQRQLKMKARLNARARRARTSR